MDVAGRADGLSELLAETDNGSVDLVKLVDVLEGAVAEHECIVARGLDFEVIVERSDLLDLSPRSALENALVELSLAARGTKNQPFPVLDQQAFGNARFFIEGLKVAVRNQLIEILQAHLVFG